MRLIACSLAKPNSVDAAADANFGGNSYGNKLKAVARIELKEKKLRPPSKEQNNKERN